MSVAHLAWSDPAGPDTPKLDGLSDMSLLITRAPALFPEQATQ